MKPRLVRALAVLLALATLALALRHDLGELALRQGESRLRAGDIAGAGAALDQAMALGGDGAPLAHNLGIALYRKGEFSRASDHFSSSLATATPELSSANHFNQGNCRVRLAETLDPRDPQAAPLLREAVADYGKALALAPGDDDSRANLQLARKRLAVLVATKDQDDGDKPATQPADNGPRDGERHRGGSKPTDTGKALENAGQTSDAKNEPHLAGKSRRDMTQPEVERLLNKARGREKLEGTLHSGAQRGQAAKPDRDW